MSHDSADTDPAAVPQRTDRGTFAPGHRGVGGRPRGQSVAAELRRQVAPDVIAAELIKLALDPTTPRREKLQALGMITDRLDGRAVSRTVNAKVTADSVLPAGFFDAPPEQRRRILDDVRRRALRGAPFDVIDTDEGDTNDQT